MFILSFTLRTLEFWSVNQTSMYENYELKVVENIKLLGSISNNWPSIY